MKRLLLILEEDLSLKGEVFLFFCFIHLPSYFCKKGNNKSPEASDTKSQKASCSKLDSTSCKRAEGIEKERRQGRR